MSKKFNSQLIEKIKVGKYNIQIFDDKKFIGYLKPINITDIDNEKLIKSIYKWRKKNISFFFNQEKVKKSSVKKYLIDEYVNNHSKILFIIYDLKNNWIGHIGLSQINKKSATLDNLIRGEKGGGKNIIFLSEKTLINWALNKLNTQSIIGKLRSDNYIMYHIHSKIGFRISKKRHLFKTIKNNKIIHELSNIDQTNVDYQVVYIKYN